MNVDLLCPFQTLEQMLDDAGITHDRIIEHRPCSIEGRFVVFHLQIISYRRYRFVVEPHICERSSWHSAEVFTPDGSEADVEAVARAAFEFLQDVQIIKLNPGLK